MPDNSIASKFRSLFVAHQQYGERFGMFGKQVASQWVIETGDGRVWVTLDDGTAIRAVNNAVARLPGLKIIVKPNRDGEMEIVGVQSAVTQQSTGQSNVPAIQSPPHRHFLGSGNEDPVEDRRFMPGLLHAFNGLTLYIESFAFRHNGVDYRWPGGTYDITGDLPVTAGYWAWVKVGIDPATNTPVAGTSTEMPLRSLLQLSDLDAIDFATNSYIPCGGVIVQEAQTAGPLEADFAEARFMPSSGGGGSSSPWTTNSNVVNLVTDTDTVTIGSATNLGKLGIDGDADEPQLVVQMHSSQTANPFIVEKSTGVDQFYVTPDGGFHANEAGNDADSHVEGDADATLTYWDAGTSRVGIGSAAPDARLMVVGREDVVQLAVLANSSQGTNLFEVRTDAGADLMTIDNTGDIVPGSDAVRSVGQAAKRFSNGFFINIIGDVQTTRVKNNSGATANVSDVGYILYTATNGAEYKTTTTANLNAAWCVVVRGAADGSDIYVATSGVVSVKLNANCSIGDFLTTSTTAGQAAVNTLMRPEVFAIALTANGGGAGGTCTARLYCNTKVVSVTNANFVWKVAGSNTTEFVATINGAPSGTSVVYNAPSAGNENCIVPNSANDLLKMRIWNTTRSSYALISTVNTGTNTITLTDTVPGSWASGDTITIESQTATTGGAFKLVEADFAKAILAGTFPSTIRHIICSMTVVDTGGAAQQGFMHPYESYAASKLFSGITVGASLFFVSGVPPFPVISGVICVALTASGTGTGNAYLNLYGYTEATP